MAKKNGDTESDTYEPTPPAKKAAEPKPAEPPPGPMTEGPEGVLTIVDGGWLPTGQTFPAPPDGPPLRFTDPESGVTYERVGANVYRATV